MGGNTQNTGKRFDKRPSFKDLSLNDILQPSVKFPYNLAPRGLVSFEKGKNKIINI